MATSLVLVLLLVASVSVGATVELTPATFDKTINSGKGTFVKFFAPWCGHCKALKPDWDKLAVAYKNSDAVTIADVDCTAEGQSLCQKHGVQGYPTLKYWKAGAKAPSDYQGGRDLNSLKSFVDKTFKPSCNPKTKKGCTQKETEFIDKMDGKTPDELKGVLKEKEDALKELRKENKEKEAEWKEYQKKYKAKETALTKAVSITKQLMK